MLRRERGINRMFSKDPSLVFRLPNKDQSSVTAQVATAKIRRHFPASLGLKLKNFLITLLHSDIEFGWRLNTLDHTGLRRKYRYFSARA